MSVTKSPTGRLTKPIPPLEQGNHLTRDEFERHYEAMSHLKKAELLEGVVHMPSPARFDDHGEQHADLITWLGVYRAATPGVRVGDNCTIRLDLDHEPQPDATMIVNPSHGGRVKLGHDGFIVGGPEFAGSSPATSGWCQLMTARTLDGERTLARCARILER